MDFLKKVASEAVNDATKSSNNNDNNGNNNNNNNNNSGDNKVASAVMGQLNNVLGGGEKGEKKEDILDKGTLAYYHIPRHISFPLPTF